MEIELGDKVKDRVTGLEGIAIGRTKWLFGCDRIIVQPEVKKGETKIEDAQSFDFLSLVVVKKAVAPRQQKSEPVKARTGGPATKADKAAMRRN